LSVFLSSVSLVYLFTHHTTLTHSRTHALTHSLTHSLTEDHVLPQGRPLMSCLYVEEYCIREEHHLSVNPANGEESAKRPVRLLSYRDGHLRPVSGRSTPASFLSWSLLAVLRDVFLPVGYPDS
jgi:hypothetical protein